MTPFAGLFWLQFCIGKTYAGYGCVYSTCGIAPQFHLDKTRQPNELEKGKGERRKFR